jgi:glucose dehydrogenase
VLAFSVLHADAALAQRNTAFSPKALTAPPRAGWPTNGGNLRNQRYSPLESINRTNVGELKGVWRTHLNGSGVAPQYSGEAQPIVHDGVIYVITGADDVFALSVETGAVPAALGEARSQDHVGLLRLDESRSRHRRGQDLRGPE